MMDETKVQIGDDVLLDIGTHSDWYISAICYDNESVNVELRRKTDRNKKWWIADTPQTDDKDINVRSKDEPQTGEMMTEEEFDSMLARVLTGKTEPQTERSE